MKQLLTAAVLVSATLLAGAARAESYTIFVCERPADLALRQDKTARGQADWADYTRPAMAAR